MRNKFPGICYRCGSLVKVGQGHFERVNEKRLEFLGIDPTSVSGNWLTQHAECAIKERGTEKSCPNLREGRKT